MGNLENSLKYPFAGEGWGPKFVLGGVINAIGAALGFIPYAGTIFLVLFSFIPLGYVYQIFLSHLRGEEGPLPAWGGWGDLFTQGFLFFLLILGYWIIPGVFYWAGIGLWYEGGFAAFIGVLFLILSIGAGLVAFFLLPMGLALYAAEGKLLPAFQLNEIVEKIGRIQKDYFIGWMAGLVLFLALLFIRTQLLYVGWILFAFGFFYLCLVMARFFGSICRERISQP